MKKSWVVTVTVATALLTCLTAPAGWARAKFEPATAPEKQESAWMPVTSDDQLRHFAVHDAGDFYSPVCDGRISAGYSTSSWYNPETGDPLNYTTYPQGSNDGYIFGGALWVGGIVNGDTLVSVSADGWMYDYEIWPEFRDSGGVRRTGNFADDEFVTILVDTIDDANPYFPFQPMGVKVTQTSSSWADPAYDDFVILEYVITNVGENEIHDGCIGLTLDNDVYDWEGTHIANGWADDISGSLDTLLYDDDPTSRVLIPYSCDNDGDPSPTWTWDASSIRGVVAVMLLRSSFSVGYQNFNWWFPNTNAFYDFGPRRVGTPDDPLRLFGDSNLGQPVTDADKYYLLSHPEVDFDQIETMIHDSSDGWIPPPKGRVMDFADGYDTRFVFSFGAFDLAPGDSVSFAIALAGGKNLFVSPRDFADYFDPLAPEHFRSRLDFSNLMANLRRVDSVFQSGMMLPRPGPPAGLHLTDYDDSYVDLAWHPSGRPGVAGYYVYIRDTLIDNRWFKATQYLITDTTATVHIFEPSHRLQLAVSLLDGRGWESRLSTPVSALTGVPHSPGNLTVTLDGIVPELSWTPYDDTSLQAFMIYRAVWDGSMKVYDSTAGLRYRDYGVESGVRYSYQVTAKGVYDLESEPTSAQTVLPMARDHGILYYNLSRYRSAPGPYPKAWVDRLYESVASRISIDRWEADDGFATFKKMADYGLIIFDRSNLPRAGNVLEDTLRYYLEGGGKAVFITGALGPLAVTPRMARYGEGSFYHDVLKLDSGFNSGVVLSGNGIVGDLTGCRSLIADYPSLTADTVKLRQATQPIIGFVPMAGYLFPTGEAETMYSYLSSNPDTAAHGMVNGIKYVGAEYGFVLMNFPLTPMQEPASMAALQQALRDLGVDLNCGDANNDGTANIGDIVCLMLYLFRDGPAPANGEHADVDNSGAPDLGDVVVLINYIFRGGRLFCGW